MEDYGSMFAYGCMCFCIDFLGLQGSLGSSWTNVVSMAQTKSGCEAGY